MSEKATESLDFLLIMLLNIVLILMVIYMIYSMISTISRTPVSVVFERDETGRIVAIHYVPAQTS